MSIDYMNGNFSDEDIFIRAKRYAAKQFDAVIQGGEITRHDINNATKITGYLMKAAEAESDNNPVELGVIVAELMNMKDSGELKLAE